MPDFQDFLNELIGKDFKSLIVRFEENNANLSVKFEDLSDGEKCFFLCAVVLAANKFYGPLFCFWDEPDNYLSISEVGHFITSLRRSFKNNGQLLVTSHNPEAIREFSDENTFFLDRKSHLEPTLIRLLSDIPATGDLINALICGGHTIMINTYNPHLTILPEDDHNRQIANGFTEDLNVNFRVIQTLRIACGWKKVLEEFKKNHINNMRQFPQMNMLLLIDFDDHQEDRFIYAKEYIPEDLRNRVFILGVKLNQEI